MAARRKPNNYMSARKKYISSRGLAGSFVTGLAALASVADATPRSFHQNTANPNTALRGDFVRIGRDMKLALKREIKREKAAR